MHRWFIFTLFTILVLLVGCSKSEKEIFEDATKGIGVHSQELFDYIDNDSNHQISLHEFIEYKKKQDKFFKISTHYPTNGVVYIDDVADENREQNQTQIFNTLFKKADRDKSDFLDFHEFQLRFQSYNRQEYSHIFVQIKFQYYRTKEHNISIDKIALKSHLFKPFNQNITLNRENATETIWVKMELPKETKTGTYRIKTPSATLDKSSFNVTQLVVMNEKYIQFSYDSTKDKKEYFFRVSSFDVYLAGVLFQKTQELEELGLLREPSYHERPSMNYYKNPKIVLLFSGVGMGLIFMALIYNLAIFYNYRKREFLYYSLLQLGMVALLYMMLNQYTPLLPRAGHFMMDATGLFISFFATLFTQAFLETKKYLPKIDLFLNLYLVLIVIDALWYSQAFLEKNHLYAIFGLLFLVAGVMRIIQGAKIAWFYLIGWFFLILATFLMEYYYSSLPFYTFYLGAGVEALMLAWGLTYKMKGNV